MKNLNANMKQLEARCNADFADYLPEGKLYTGRRGQHVFQDNGAKVLAVCHLDTVQQGKDYAEIKSNGDKYLMSPRLDDRLGAFIILDVLPKMGCKFDVLLTDGEEYGCSTAADFYGEGYNWMFSFDRSGTQTVMYQYETKQLRKAVMQSGAVTGYGSYSDIYDLEHLGIAGFNWGTGYYNYHSADAYASVRDVSFCISTFVKFYQRNKNTKFAHVPYKPTRAEKKASRYLKRAFFTDHSRGNWDKAAQQDLEDYYRKAEADYNKQVDNWDTRDTTFYDNEFSSREEHWYDPYSESRANIR